MPIPLASASLIVAITNISSFFPRECYVGMLDCTRVSKYKIDLYMYSSQCAQVVLEIYTALESMF